MTNCDVNITGYCEVHKQESYKCNEEKTCSYCGGWGSDNGYPCPDCGKEMVA